MWSNFSHWYKPEGSIWHSSAQIIRQNKWHPTGRDVRRRSHIHQLWWKSFLLQIIFNQLNHIVKCSDGRTLCMTFSNVFAALLSSGASRRADANSMWKPSVRVQHQLCMNSFHPKYIMSHFPGSSFPLICWSQFCVRPRWIMKTIKWAVQLWICTAYFISIFVLTCGSKETTWFRLETFKAVCKMEISASHLIWL